MPSLQRMDERTGLAQRAAQAGVCEPTQVRYPRKRREGWPFRYYEEGGKMYENYVPRRDDRKPNLDDVEEALW